MNRSLGCLTILASFLLAFGGTALVGVFGPTYQPLTLWALYLMVGLWMWQIPALKKLDTKLIPLFFYCLWFLFLWLLSNPWPTSLRLLALKYLLALVAALGIYAGYGVLATFAGNRSLRRLVRALIPLFVCGWLVAYFSSSTGAGSHMLEFAIKVLGLSRDAADLLVEIVRKSLHFLFYGTIGLLAFRAARIGGTAKKAVALGLLFVLFHSSFDELRQALYADRTGSFWDVCLDMAGACVFVVGASMATIRAETSKR